MQQNDSKESGKTEEAAQRAESIVVDSADAPDSAQSDGHNPATESEPALNPEAIAEEADGTAKAKKNGDASEYLPEEAGLNERIAELEAKLAEAGDQFLRKAADFENFRKRMHQEKQSAIEFANQNLLLDIIPIIDDFERAIQSAEASKELSELPAGKVMLDGITMIEKRLSGQLESKWGLKRFNSAGEPFDPNRHEAMLMEKSPDITEAMVQEDFIRGYMLKDRIIRAAKVKVVMPEE